MPVLIQNRQQKIRPGIQGLARDSRALLKLYGLERAELGVLLVGDGRMKELNRLYRGKDRPTDVLAFPQICGGLDLPGMHEGAGLPVSLGDVVINIHAARRQAAEYGHSLAMEVRRLLVHGFLHLLGYDHENCGSELRRMKRQERKALQHLRSVVPRTAKGH